MMTSKFGAGGGGFSTAAAMDEPGRKRTEVGEISSGAFS
jgi:hypothetical protein